MSAPRVRFAPSPTGRLHLGNARTGLFNHLYARRHAGALVLRIEDTDQARSSSELEEGILDDLAWLGITPDEGVGSGGDHGPYRQTERSEIYAEHITRLIESGDAYPCYCTTEEIEAEREAAKSAGLAYRYSGRCRSLSAEQRAAAEAAGKRSALRFRVPEAQTVRFTDEIRGEISFETRDIGDFIIRRSDGSPLYSIANVIDDHLMEITHVIRGEEFISTTPTQVLIGEALGFSIPHFAHLPLLLSPSGGKLSKREAAVAVDDYRREGFLAEAMVNFLTLLGWSPPGEENIFTLAELERLFDFDHVQKAGAVFDREKLLHLNGVHIRRLAPAELTDRLLEGDFIPQEWGGDRARLESAVATIQDRLRLLSDAPKLLDFYFSPPAPTELTAQQQGWIRELLGRLPGDWAQDSLDSALKAFLAAEGLTPKELFVPLRLALTGAPASPPIAEVMSALGPDETRNRLSASLDS